MRIAELIQRIPAAAPCCWFGPYGVWFFDERWRLPYRWWEFRIYREPDIGFGAMLFGAAVMVIYAR